MRRAPSIVVGLLMLAIVCTPAQAAPPPSTPPPPGERRSPAPPPPMLPGQGQSAREVEAPTGEGFAGLGMEPQTDGTWRYVDPTGHFTARFEADGSVNFADRWRRPDARDSQTGRCCAPPPPATSIRGGWAMNGPTEWMYRWLGEDVSARKKAELLKLTLDLRLALAIEHMRGLIDEALAQLITDLDALRHDPTLDEAQKRQRVFEIWDDCDERIPSPNNGMPAEAESEIDAARLDAAKQARRKIEAWIRLRMPQGTTRGYTAKQIARLDATRLSAEAFDPYTEPPANEPPANEAP